jgi:predicted membrane channel-forming protein YqfA (hemolysin III family)
MGKPPRARVIFFVVLGAVLLFIFYSFFRTIGKAVPPAVLIPIVILILVFIWHATNNNK